jgi:hypothetical protein
MAYDDDVVNIRLLGAAISGGRRATADEAILVENLKVHRRKLLDAISVLNSSAPSGLLSRYLHRRPRRRRRLGTCSSVRTAFRALSDRRWRQPAWRAAGSCDPPRRAPAITFLSAHGGIDRDRPPVVRGDKLGAPLLSVSLAFEEPLLASRRAGRASLRRSGPV